MARQIEPTADRILTAVGQLRSVTITCEGFCSLMSFTFATMTTELSLPRVFHYIRIICSAIHSATTVTVSLNWLMFPRSDGNNVRLTSHVEEVQSKWDPSYSFVARPLRRLR